MDVREEDFKDLKDKVNHLEYTEIKGIKDDMAKIKEKEIKTTTLLDQNKEVLSKLTCTLEHIQETMIKLGNNMQLQNESVNQLSNKVTTLENKIDIVESNNNLNISKFCRDHWFNIITISAVVLYIIFGKYIQI
jgi:predicted nuclease with TOPRIM domain